MKEYKVDFEEVLLQVESTGWEFVYSQFPELSDALANAQKNKTSMVPCPKMGGGPKSTKFRFYKDWRSTGGGVHNDAGAFKGGVSLIMWLKDWDYVTTMMYLASLMGMNTNYSSSGNQTYVSKSTLQRRETLQREKEERDKTLLVQTAKEDEQKKKRLAQLMSESFPLTDQRALPVRQYLSKRGINFSVFPKELRFHPSVPFFDEEKQQVVGNFPCILGLIRNVKGEPVTLHRIYLDNEGNKAPFEEVKKMMSAPSDKPVLGSAIRLADDPNSTVLHVAEGIETAMAVMSFLSKGTGKPDGLRVWSSINATLLAGLEVPKNIKRVIIWADKDQINPRTGFRTGEKKANELKAKLWSQGVMAAIFVPKKEIPEGSKSIDWLDILNSGEYQINKDYVDFVIENLSVKRTAA